MILAGVKIMEGQVLTTFFYYKDIVPFSTTPIFCRQPFLAEEGEAMATSTLPEKYTGT